ncbi:hypothetical protein [Streptomyces sp. CC224B]|uniref:hypothetical protein n=1 Tax=Streptomyces sp. CC224B TaxID=3044571 RepID=UPI0024A7FB55|nr:hypothetical protein [Streptomyces sp. CC224B]
MSRKFATGAVALASVAAMASVATPANAAPKPAAKAAAVTMDTKVTAVKGCGGWKNAVGIPGRWSTSKWNCDLIGSPGLKVGYRWVAERGTPCIKVRGYVKGGPRGYREKWYNAGCGKSGYLKNVPWGYVASTRAIKIKGFAMLKWR